MDKMVLQKKLNELALLTKCSLHDIFRGVYTEKLEIEEAKYVQAIRSYKRIIKIITILLDELNFSDELDVFNIYNYLLWNGYLSINHKYMYSNSERTKMSVHLGADIMTGKGKCLQNADLLAQILKEKGLFAMVLPVFFDDAPELEYVPSIERDIIQSTESVVTSRFNKSISLLSKKIVGNHAIVLIEKNGHYYGIDPTNLLVLKLDDYFALHVLNGTGSAIIKPLSIAILNETDGKEIHSIISSYQNKDSLFLPADYVEEKSEDMLFFCIRNHSLLDGFYSEIRNDIAIVDSELRKIK